MGRQAKAKLARRQDLALDDEANALVSQAEAFFPGFDNLERRRAWVQGEWSSRHPELPPLVQRMLDRAGISGAQQRRVLQNTGRYTIQRMLGLPASDALALASTTPPAPTVNRVQGGLSQEGAYEAKESPGDQPSGLVVDSQVELPIDSSPELESAPETVELAVKVEVTESQHEASEPTSSAGTGMDAADVSPPPVQMGKKQRRRERERLERDLAFQAEFLLLVAEEEFPDDAVARMAWASEHWAEQFPQCPPLVRNGVFVSVSRRFQVQATSHVDAFQTEAAPVSLGTNLEPPSPTPASDEETVESSVTPDVLLPMTGMGKKRVREERERLEKELLEERDSLLRQAQEQFPGDPPAQSDWACAQWGLKYPACPPLIRQGTFREAARTLQRIRFRCGETGTPITPPAASKAVSVPEVKTRRDEIKARVKERTRLERELFSRRDDWIKRVRELFPDNPVAQSDWVCGQLLATYEDPSPLLLDSLNQVTIDFYQIRFQGAEASSAPVSDMVEVLTAPAPSLEAEGKTETGGVLQAQEIGEPGDNASQDEAQDEAIAAKESHKTARGDGMKEDKRRREKELVEERDSLLQQAEERFPVDLIARGHWVHAQWEQRYPKRPLFVRWKSFEKLTRELYELRFALPGQVASALSSIRSEEAATELQMVGLFDDAAGAASEVLPPSSPPSPAVNPSAGQAQPLAKEVGIVIGRARGKKDGAKLVVRTDGELAIERPSHSGTHTRPAQSKPPLAKERVLRPERKKEKRAEKARKREERKKQRQQALAFGHSVLAPEAPETVVQQRPPAPVLPVESAATSEPVIRIPPPVPSQHAAVLETVIRIPSPVQIGFPTVVETKITIPEPAQISLPEPAHVVFPKRDGPGLMITVEPGGRERTYPGIHATYIIAPGVEFVAEEPRATVYAMEGSIVHACGSVVLPYTEAVFAAPVT